MWKNATGVAERGGRVIRYGLKGSADILGIVAPGRFLAIEVKTGSAVQTAEQKAFEAVISGMGGLYVLARAADDVELALQMAGAGCA